MAVKHALSDDLIRYKYLHIYKLRISNNYINYLSQTYRLIRHIYTSRNIDFRSQVNTSRSVTLTKGGDCLK